VRRTSYKNLEFLEALIFQLMTSQLMRDAGDTRQWPAQVSAAAVFNLDKPGILKEARYASPIMP
jgi:hypothetical protein